MKILYVADDGKEFYNEFECEDYEWKLHHPYLNHVIFYDKDNNKLDPFKDGTYEKTEKVFVPDNDSLDDLLEYANYTGYCAYTDISFSGTWVWSEDEMGFVEVE